MIIVIDAINRDQFGDLLDDMFRLRARVFGDRLGWEVTVREGREIDRFDRLDPAYLVGLDEEGHVVSCARLLQTTGPHMLADVFATILDGEPPLRSSRLWESTRFCVDTERLKNGRSGNGISRMTCEMIVGLLEYGQRSGISDIVTVIDPVMDRVLKRSACPPYDYVGSQKPMGRVAALAALIDCSEERIQAVRAFAGLEGEVFLSDEDALKLFERKNSARTSSNIVSFPAHQVSEQLPVSATVAEILEYCISQVRTAATPDEQRKAGRLIRSLLNEVGLAEQIAALVEDMEAEAKVPTH